jgi:hypothetical protein
LCFAKDRNKKRNNILEWRVYNLLNLDKMMLVSRLFEASAPLSQKVRYRWFVTLKIYKKIEEIFLNSLNSFSKKRGILDYRFFT